MISILGNLVGFLIFIGFIYLIINSMKTHPEAFELEEGEEIQELVKGDYWVKEILWQEKQNSGELAFTNKRVIFKGMFLNSADKFVSIPYTEILSIEKTFVGLFFPVALKITTKDNQTYKFAVMKRDKYINLMQQMAQNN